jgi:hypothetical protein
MNVDEQVSRLLSEIEDRQKKIKWLVEHRDKLQKTGVQLGSCVGDILDFDNLTHKEVIGVVRALGGKWKKTPNFNKAGRIDYQTEIDGMSVRCWAGEAPPSCKIVEVEELVPEQVIPAHVKKVRKMICSDNKEPLVTAAIQAMARSESEAAQ